jgi:DNA-binding response OmpR family regulator
MERQAIMAVSKDMRDIRMLSSILERAELRVIPACTGLEAVARLESTCPALVLLDIPFPDAEAQAVCGMIRGRLRTRYLPVLVLSARDEPEARIAAFQSGADDFLAKPFDPAELVMRIQVLLRRSIASQPSSSPPRPPRRLTFREEVEARLAGDQ